MNFNQGEFLDITIPLILEAKFGDDPLQILPISETTPDLSKIRVGQIRRRSSHFGGNLVFLIIFIRSLLR